MSLRQQNKRIARARMIDAARELVAEVGIEQATTREIARRAGVSYQTLYNYYPTKALIISELLEAEFNNLSAMLQDIIKRYDGDLLTTISALVSTSLEVAQGEHRALFKELTGVAMASGLDDSQMTQQLNVAHEQFHALLSMAQGTGELRSDLDLHLMAHTLFNLLDYALLMVVLIDQDTQLVQTNIDQQMDLLVAPYLTDT